VSQYIAFGTYHKAPENILAQNNLIEGEMTMTRKITLLSTLFLLSWVLTIAFPASQVNAAFFIDPDAYWRIDETAAPYSDEFAVPANGNDAVVNNAFTGTPSLDAAGRVGNAVAFGGDSGLWIFDGGSEVWDWAANASFSMEVWIKRAAGGLDTEGETEVIFGRDDTGSTSLQWWVGLRYNAANGPNPRVVARLIDADGDGASVLLNDTGTSFTDVVDGNWHHIVLVRDAATLQIKLYVDGNLEDTAENVNYETNPLGFETSVSSLDIGWLGISGSSNTDFAFNGSVDQIALYGSALTAAQVSQVFQIGTAGKALDDEFAPIYSAGTTDLGISAVGYPVSTSAVPAANPVPDTYSLDAGAPAGMSVDNTGLVTWFPASADAGASYPFSVTATNTIGPGTGDYTVAIVNPCSTDLDAYWHLEADGSAGYANDTATSDLTGVCATGGCPTQDTVAGKVNNAQTFDGSTGIDIPFSPTANQVFDWSATDSFTVELWMKRDANGLPNNNDTEVLMGRWDDDMQWFIGVRRLGGGGPLRIAAKLIADGNENDVLIADGPSGTDVTDAQWHHVALVRDESTNTTHLYVDGALEASNTFDYTAGFTSTTRNLSIGYLDGGSFGLNGSLDEVAIYGSALDPTVILQHATLNPGRGYCNSDPRITTAADTDADPVEDYTYDADAQDDDTDTLTWSVVTGPANMTIDAQGVVTWPQADVSAAAGTTVPVEIQAADAFGGVGTQSWDLTVSGVATVAPQITGQAALSTAVETPLTITLTNLTVVDSDSTFPDDFTLTVMDGTDYARVDNTITPGSGFTGDLTVPVSVNDGTNDSNTFNLTVTVSDTVTPGGGGGGGGGGGCFINTSSAGAPTTLVWSTMLMLAGLVSGAFMTHLKK
jgi:hypothetical protein